MSIMNATMKNWDDDFNRLINRTTKIKLKPKTNVYLSKLIN